MGNLRLCFIQILNRKSQHVGCRSKREAGTGGIVSELRYGKSGIKNPGGDVFGAHLLQGFCHQQYQVELIAIFLPGEQKIFPHEAHSGAADFIDDCVDVFHIF